MYNPGDKVKVKTKQGVLDGVYVCPSSSIYFRRDKKHHNIRIGLFIFPYHESKIEREC